MFFILYSNWFYFSDTGETVLKATCNTHHATRNTEFYYILFSPFSFYYFYLLCIKTLFLNFANLYV